MKVLLVTDRYVYEENSELWCPQDFYNIIARMTRLGEIHMCCPRKIARTGSNLIFDWSLNDLMKPQHLTFIDKSFVVPRATTRKAICKAISEVDLVVGYLPSLNAEFSESYAHRLGKKYMSLVCACTWDGLWNQDWKRKIVAPYRYLLNRHVLSHTDYALYVTNEFLQRRYPANVGNSNSVGISDVVLEENHVGELELRLARIEALKPDDEVKIATTATLNVPFKGQRFVIAALAKLKKMGYAHYHYYLIGGGSSDPLQREAERYDVTDQVHFVGKLTHDQVFDFLRQVDVYVHPSLQEGLPRSVVEAMSVALPCIGARTAAIPELLDPTFVVKRKSVDDIVDKLLLLDKPTMAAQARRNYQEAQNYRCDILDERRNKFYDHIVEDMSHA